MSDYEAVEVVRKFLNMNYPCNCDGQDQYCPENYYEAYEIIELLKKAGVQF
jgi:hypothetical protein